jgi:hypothetical protein
MSAMLFFVIAVFVIFLPMFRRLESESLVTQKMLMYVVYP